MRTRFSILYMYQRSQLCIDVHQHYHLEWGGILVMLERRVNVSKQFLVTSSKAKVHFRRITEKEWHLKELW